MISELFKSKKVLLLVGAFNSVEKILQSIKEVKDKLQAKIMCTSIEYPNDSSYKGINFEDGWNDGDDDGKCFNDIVDV